MVGAVAALWAALIGVAIVAVPLLVIWMATPASGLSWLDSLNLAGLVWAVAHGAPVVISGVTYSLLPWGLAVVPVLLMIYAGGWAARTSRATTMQEISILTGTAAVVYAVVAGVLVQLVGDDSAQVSVLDAVVHAALIGLLAFGFGAVRRSCVLAGRFPAWVAATVRAGFVSLLVLIGIGAIVAAIALAARFDEIVTLTQSLHAGLWGGLALTILGIAYLPVLILWSTAYIIGAGIVIGPAVTVSAFLPVTAPTQLPPFPILAAIPQSSSPLAWALPVVGVVAGLIGGVVVSRRAREDSRLMRLVMALGAAAIAATMLFVLAWLSSGALGDARLANLGPAPVTVAVLAFVLITLGAVPSAVVAAPPSGRSLTVLEPTLAEDGEAIDV